jgi:hypothetical protein
VLVAKPSAGLCCRSSAAQPRPYWVSCFGRSCLQELRGCPSLNLHPSYTLGLLECSYCIPIYHAHPLTMDEIPARNTRLASQENAGDVCRRCSRMWRTFAYGRSPAEYIGKIRETREELADSGCRICRLIAHVAFTHRITATPLTMRWDPNDGHQSCIEISFTWPKIIESTSPMLLLSRLDKDSISSRLDELPAKELDMTAARRWINHCKDQHGYGCKPLSQTRLSALKVIDCKQRAIVPLLPNCEYVALSYVWGSVSNSASERLEDAPATIEDSITVTLALGYHYIWVDRYVRMLISRRSIMTSKTYSVLTKATLKKCTRRYPR